MMKNFLPLVLIIMLVSCRAEEPEKKPSPAPAPAREQSCRDCHDLVFDEFHREIACISCHAGREKAAGAEAAHEGLIAHPAHPDHMERNCGPCHGDALHTAARSLHFTLKNEVNAVRGAFGLAGELASLTEIPQHEEIESNEDLVDDMLRRRCLRCHVYYGGDYPGTRRGRGCAACHLEFSGGEMTSHAFVKSPPDSQCLHCHIGNYVGGDYHGLFEHDFHWEYRTPFNEDGTTSRPYGLEYHQLDRDVHQRAGMACIDCHSGRHLMGEPGTTTRCVSCHEWRPGDDLLADNLRREGDSLVVTGRLSGREHRVPRLSHPAHRKFKEQARCTVCHAGWAFQDKGTHLLRLDVEEFEPWEDLLVQGCYEVEDQILVSLYADESYPVIFMSDKISGEIYTGIWLKGFELRRWEYPLICPDAQGKLAVCRPLLDLTLTFVNEDEEVQIDSLVPVNRPPHGLLPYTPHTIGKAGAFYTERLRQNETLLDWPMFLPKHSRDRETP